MACRQRHLERGRGQLGAQVIGHGPADNLATVCVEDDRQVQPVWGQGMAMVIEAKGIVGSLKELRAAAPTRRRSSA